MYQQTSFNKVNLYIFPLRKSGLLRNKKRRDTTVIRVDKKTKPRKNWGTLLKDPGSAPSKDERSDKVDANAWQKEETGSFFGWLSSFFAG